MQLAATQSSAQPTRQSAAMLPRPIDALVFFLVCLLLFPVMLVGYVVWIATLYLGGRRSGVSTTAQGPLFARWLMHQFGVRQDEAAHRLLPELPGVPRLGLDLTAGPILFAHRLTGYVPGAFRYPYEGKIVPGAEASLRVAYFDSVVERYLADHRQLVILGSGFDTRAFRLPRDSQVRAFEIDRTETVATKRLLLRKTGIDISGVTFVAADFEQGDWLARLVEAGFEPQEPALFLWEGVTMYLNRAAIEATLRTIAGTATGSAVTFDYFTSDMLTSQGLYARYARAATKAAGEPMKFGVDSRPPSRQRLAELLASCGLSLAEQRTLGDETGGRRAWGGFAVATV
jgi:methyltransferase (TIGR00027 family)